MRHKAQRTGHLQVSILPRAQNEGARRNRKAGSAEPDLYLRLHCLINKNKNYPRKKTLQLKVITQHLRLSSTFVSGLRQHTRLPLAFRLHHPLRTQFERNNSELDSHLLMVPAPSHILSSFLPVTWLPAPVLLGAALLCLLLYLARIYFFLHPRRKTGNTRNKLMMVDIRGKIRNAHKSWAASSGNQFLWSSYTHLLYAQLRFRNELCATQVTFEKITFIAPPPVNLLKTPGMPYRYSYSREICVVLMSPPLACGWVCCRC